MGYPGYPPHPGYGYPPPPAKPQRSAPDMVFSIILMVLTVVTVAVGGFLGLFFLAFLDSCPPATCSVDGAVTSVLTGVGVAALLGVAGIIFSIVQLVRRKQAWPFAVGTFALCVAVLFFGGVGFVTAVGG